MRRTLLSGWRRDWRWRTAPLALFTALALPNLFGGDWSVDTPRYAAVGLYAWREGAWWTLALGDQPYFNKPPLAFWAHGLLLWLLGPSLFVARLPTLLAGLGVVACATLTARTLAGRRAALLTGLCCAGVVELFRQVGHISLDMWLALCLAWASALLARGATQQRRAPVALSGLAVGLGLLVKPFVALGFFPIAAVWLVWTRRRQLLGPLLAGAALAVAVAAPWHVSMLALHGRAFLDEYVGRQVVGRTLGEAFRPEPWWWYGAFLLRTYWPWLLPAALGALAGRAFAASPRRHDAEAWAMAVLWVGLWLVALSAAADKRARYAMLLYPMTSLLAGLWLARRSPAWLSRGAGRRVLAPLTLAAPLASAALVVGGLRVHEPPEPHWTEVARFVREHAAEPIWDGSLDYGDGPRLYLETGVWPRGKVRRPPGAPTDWRRPAPPPGALALFDERRQPPPPQSTRLLEAGPIVAVRMPAQPMPEEAVPPSPSR